jgi:hypothetical protein
MKLLERFWWWLRYGPQQGGLAPTKEQMLPRSIEGRYILRPRDGIQYGPLPARDGAHGDQIAWIKGTDSDGELYIAVCDFCGGNCGQCGTSIGQGIPFDFDRIIYKSGMWKGPPAGFPKR